MAVPVLRAVGSIGAGTGAVTPGAPAGTVAGDLLIMGCECHRTESVTVSGWTLLHSLATADDTGGNDSDCKLSVFWKIAESSTPSRTTNDPGDHILARIIGIQVDTFDSGDPIPVSRIDKEDIADSSISFQDITTPTPDNLVIGFVAQGFASAVNSTRFSSWANGSLTNIVERIDNQDNSVGNGGCLGAYSGDKDSAGSVGITTASGATSYKAMCHFAVQPVQDNSVNGDDTGAGADTSILLPEFTYQQLQTKVISAAVMTAATR